MSRPTAKQRYRNGNRTTEVLKQYKDEILTELHDTGILQNKISGICLRNKAGKDTGIGRDLFQETFWHLSRNTPEFIIELYEDKPKRLIGLGVHIAVKKGFLKSKLNPDYPKHSHGLWLLYLSNLNRQNAENFMTDEDIEDQEFIDVLSDNSLVEYLDRELDAADVWKAILPHLSEDELELYGQLIEVKKRKGHYSQTMKKRIADFHQKVRDLFKRLDLNERTYSGYESQVKKDDLGEAERIANSIDCYEVNTIEEWEEFDLLRTLADSDKRYEKTIDKNFRTKPLKKIRKKKTKIND